MYSRSILVNVGGIVTGPLLAGLGWDEMLDAAYLGDGLADVDLVVGGGRHSPIRRALISPARIPVRAAKWISTPHGSGMAPDSSETCEAVRNSISDGRDCGRSLRRSGAHGDALIQPSSTAALKIGVSTRYALRIVPGAEPFRLIAASHLRMSVGRISSDWPRPEVRAQVLVEDAVVTGERLGSLKREHLQPVVRDLVEGAGSVPRIDVLAALKIGASPGRCVPRILDVGEGLGAPVALAVVIAVLDAGPDSSRRIPSGSPSSYCFASRHWSFSTGYMHVADQVPAERRRSRSWCGLVEGVGVVAVETHVGQWESSARCAGTAWATGWRRVL